jgi:hypothetical protein
VRAMEQEVYEGALIAMVLASHKKVKAGLKYAASGKHQDYPPGILELGVALDGLDMFVTDILKFVKTNAIS